MNITQCCPNNPVMGGKHQKASTYTALNTSTCRMNAPSILKSNYLNITFLLREKVSHFQTLMIKIYSQGAKRAEISIASMTEQLGFLHWSDHVE